MIKFFRKIRQKLLERKRVSKYLLYAFGEIVLVVIGILIALQINNWNEHQKAIKKESEVIASLQQEIEKNIYDLEKTLQSNKYFINKTDSIITFLDNNLLEFSNSKIARVFDYETFALEIPELENIIEKNSELLVSRKELITEFRELKFTFNRVKESQDFLDDFWKSKVTSFFIDCGIYLIPDSNKETLININDFTKKGYSLNQFKALLYAKQGLLKVWNNDQKNALKKCKKVLKLIQKT